MPLLVYGCYPSQRFKFCVGDGRGEVFCFVAQFSRYIECKAVGQFSQTSEREGFDPMEWQEVGLNKLSQDGFLLSESGA